MGWVDEQEQTRSFWPVPGAKHGLGNERSIRGAKRSGNKLKEDFGASDEDIPDGNWSVQGIKNWAKRADDAKIWAGGAGGARSRRSVVDRTQVIYPMLCCEGCAQYDSAVASVWERACRRSMGQSACTGAMFPETWL